MQIAKTLLKTLRLCKRKQRQKHANRDKRAREAEEAEKEVNR